MAGAAAAATTPQPAPGQVAGVESRGGSVIQPGLSVFYQQVNHRLTLIEGTASGFGTPTDLGGVLTSGPAALEQQGLTEFVDETVFARAGAITPSGTDGSPTAGACGGRGRASAAGRWAHQP